MSRKSFVKKANQQYEYSVAEIQELKRCSEDVEYFIDTYCMIQSAVDGAIPFRLRSYQKNILATFDQNRLSIALAPRQIGKSWIAGAYLLWYAMFRFEQTVLILSNKNDNAMELIHRCRFIYERLPQWLVPGISADGWNKHSVGFDNGSRIISQATTENSGRGLAISLMFLDEFAFVRDSAAEAFWTSIAPTIATGGKCIICSTPNGDTNRFAQLWRGALVDSNGFVPITIKWDDPPGRDEHFKEQEIAKIGLTKWMQEYECAFISSDPLLIDTVVLANLTKAVMNNRPAAVMGEVKFWKKPQTGVTYVMGVDPATGSGNDFTVFAVYEFPALELVAEFRSNTMSSPTAYQVLKKLLLTYERAGSTIYFSVENNGVGEGIISLLMADDTPPSTAEFVSEPGAARVGMTTTGKTKIRTCLTLKEMVERSTINIVSPVLVEELKQFIRRGGSYAAKTGGTDDYISATLIALRVVDEMSSYDQQAYDKIFSKSYFADYESEYSEYDNSYEADPVVF